MIFYQLKPRILESSLSNILAKTYFTTVLLLLVLFYYCAYILRVRPGIVLICTEIFSLG